MINYMCVCVCVYVYVCVCIYIVYNIKPDNIPELNGL